MAKYVVDPKLLNPEKPAKKKKLVETPIEKKEKQRKKANKFSESYEENLIRQLFEEKKNKIQSMDIPDSVEQEDKI
jgi:hypothetical protein